MAGLLKKAKIKWERDRGVFKAEPKTTKGPSPRSIRAKRTETNTRKTLKDLALKGSQTHPPGGAGKKSVNGMADIRTKAAPAAKKKAAPKPKPKPKAAAPKATTKTRQKMVGRYQTSARETVKSRSGPGKVKAPAKKKLGQSLRVH